MAVRKRLRPSGTAADAARAAGIRPGDGPVTLTEVDRRRTQLWTTTLFVIVALVAIVAAYWLAYDVLPEQMQLQSFSSYVLAVLIVGLLIAFVVYLIENERRLRALSSLLIEERVLSAALSNRLSEVTTLVEVGKAMNSTLELSDVLDLILSSALEMLEGTEGSIMLLEDDGEHLKLVSYKGPVDATVVTGRGKVGVGIAGTVAADRTPMLIQGDRIGRGLQGHPERGISSAMCVPLVRNGELLGVLNLNKTHGAREFSDGDLHTLGLFAEHAAIAVGNARIFESNRQTIQRLEELDQLKSDFVATISHELKTPLTAIIGSAKRISRKGRDMDPDQRAELVEMIERQGNRLLRLVQDVLTTSQIESGRVMKRVLVDLRAAAEEVVQELREAKVGTDRQIDLTIEPEEPHIWGDTIALQQVMANLIENALKYSESGPVHVIVRETHDEGFIQVSDHGAGISEVQLRDIFERFHQVDSSSTRKVGGFGLGLFIVKQLVDGHGGTIDVESTLGVGTTFTVHLPKRSSDRGRLNTDPDPGNPR